MGMVHWRCNYRGKGWREKGCEEGTVLVEKGVMKITQGKNLRKVWGGRGDGVWRFTDTGQVRGQS